MVDCPDDMRCAVDGKVMVNPVPTPTPIPGRIRFGSIRFGFGFSGRFQN